MYSGILRCVKTLKQRKKQKGKAKAEAEADAKAKEEAKKSAWTGIRGEHSSHPLSWL